jgi:membrane protease YdiL (CAAX protease family)
MLEHDLGEEAPPWRRWHIAALAFTLAFPSLSTWLYFVVLAGHPVMQVAYGVGKVVQFAFPILFVWLCLKQMPRLARPKRDGLGVGLLFGAVVLFGALGLYALFSGSEHLVGASEAVTAKMSGAGVGSRARFLALAVFYCVFHSLMEEYYWRWFAYGQLRRLLPQAPANAIASVGFMGHHVIVIGQFFDSWAITLALSVGVALGGAFWAWLYERTRSLYGPWLSHVLIDAALMAIGYQMMWGS